MIGDSYCPPSGFCYDEDCTDSPIQDDPSVDGYNVAEIVEEFVSMVLSRTQVTRGNAIMLAMGCDFQYSNAGRWYKYMDRLIRYVNEDGRLDVFYSTPTQYAEEKMKR